MGKDGGGGDSVGGYSYSSTTPSKDIFDIHIETLKLIGAEMARLHQQISDDNGDHIELYVERLEQLHTELCRLSEALSDAEVECTTNGNH